MSYKTITDKITRINTRQKGGENKKMEQTREEMHKKIAKASNRKILRRQIELLAEYSRLPCCGGRVPEASEAITEIHKELIKRECFTAMLIAAFVYFVLSIVKHIK